MEHVMYVPNVLLIKSWDSDALQEGISNRTRGGPERFVCCGSWWIRFDGIGHDAAGIPRAREDNPVSCTELAEDDDVEFSEEDST